MSRRLSVDCFANGELEGRAYDQQARMGDEAIVSETLDGEDDR